MVGKKIASHLTLKNSLISIGLVAVLLCCIPPWWLFAGWAEMKTWYPSMGGLVFIVKTAFLIIALFVISLGSLFIVFRNRKSIQEFFGNLPSHKKRGLTALGVSIIMYILYTLFGDVLVEWTYPFNPTLTQWMYIKFIYYLKPVLWIFVVFIMIAACLFLIGRKRKWNTQVYKRSFGFLMSFAFSWILLELSLRTLGLFASYAEIRFGEYSSPYDIVIYDGGRSVFVLKADTHYVHKSPEFSFDRYTNSMGFVDREFSTEKPLGCRRILCFGDSFTEGDGAPTDSAYPVLLENELNAMDSSTSWEVWNVGIRGSDPIFNYMTYEKLLRTFEADFIIQTISENDIRDDFVIRGGMNRYNSEGELAIESPVWWEAIYANSHVARLFLHYLGGYDYTLMTKKTRQKRRAQAVGHTQSIIDQWQNACTIDNRNLLFVLLPLHHNTTFGLWRKEMRSVKNYLSTQYNDTLHLDLLPDYVKYSRRDQQTIYYWPQDGHHTSKGYQMMAESIAKHLTATHQQ